MSTNEVDVQRAIIKGVNELISQISDNTEKLLSSLKGYINALKPTLEANKSGFKLILTPSPDSPTPENICEALQILDRILLKKKLTAVLLMDEFQEIERVAKDKGIEGAIRHVAQETQAFSMLRQLFLKKQPPSANKMRMEWQNLVERHRNDLLSETRGLNIIHKKILVAIANGINTELTGKKFLSMSQLSSASATRAIDHLVAEDFIEKDKNYRIVNPMLEQVIQQLTSF